MDCEDGLLHLGSELPEGLQMSSVDDVLADYLDFLGENMEWMLETGSQSSAADKQQVGLHDFTEGRSELTGEILPPLSPRTGAVTNVPSGCQEFSMEPRNDLNLLQLPSEDLTCVSPTQNLSHLEDALLPQEDASLDKLSWLDSLPPLIELQPQSEANMGYDQMDASMYNLQGNSTSCNMQADNLHLVGEGSSSPALTGSRQFPHQAGYLIPAQGTEDTAGNPTDEGGCCSDTATFDRAAEQSPVPDTPHRRRDRSNRQQMLNKFAQQRYRERKKQKAREVEQAAARLSSRMGALSVLHSQQEQLKQQNRALQQKIDETGTQLSKANAAVQYNGLVQERDSELDQKRIEKDAERPSYAIEAAVLKLRRQADELGAEEAVNVETTDTAAMQTLRGTMEEILGLYCQFSWGKGKDADKEFLNAKNICTGPDSCLCYSCKRQLFHIDLIKYLQLQSNQCQQLLYIRKEYKQKLSTILQQRQHINIQMFDSMLPKNQDQDSSVPSCGHKSASHSLRFLQRAQHISSMKEVVDHLQRNLRSEQHLLIELDYIVTQRILTPMQGAKLILECFPQKFDSIAISDAVQLINENNC